MGFCQYFTIGQRLVVNFRALQKQAKLIKLNIAATKHKINTCNCFHLKLITKC